MHRLLGMICFGVIVSGAQAQAQTPPTYGVYTGTNSLYGAPGYFGTSYGTASYGVPRLSSSFNSPYGVGYGGGYPAVGFLPGRFGSDLWRPGFSTSGYVYGAPTSYRTFPVRVWPAPTGYGPGIGAYAPGFGPAPLLVR